MNENITPLPFYADENDETIYTADGDAVCEVFLYSDDRTEKLREYILEACNAYPALTARVKELEEALAEAIGWNWLDGDVPQEIQDKCCDPLNKEPPK